MTTTIQISDRGTMTLPKPIRRILGVDNGGVVIADVSENGILLHPAVAYPIEMYSDARVREFDEADAELGRHLKRARK